VRQLFAWVGLERCSIGEVCRRWQARQIRTPKGKPYWDRTTVWGILKNPAYKGQAQYGGTQVGPRRARLRPLRGRKAQPRRAVTTYDTPESDRITIEVPALVSADLFAAVAEQLQENRRRQRERRHGACYLLQGSGVRDLRLRLLRQATQPVGQGLGEALGVGGGARSSPLLCWDLHGCSPWT
jgi:site-specific DNA recombinase